MADETPEPRDDLADAEQAGFAGSSGFARIVDAMLASPRPPRKRSAGRRPPETAKEDPAGITPGAALERAQELVRGGQVDAGLTLCHRVWPVVAEAGDVPLMGICQSALLLGYHYKGMCRAAVAAGRLGLTLLDRAGDELRKLHVMSQLAANLARAGRLTEAFETLYRGTQLLPSIESDPLTQCRFWTNAAATYGALDLHDDAMTCALKGAALAELIDDPAMVTTARGNVVISRLAVLRYRRASWQEIEPVHRELLDQVDKVTAEGRQHLVLAMAVTGADALVSVQRWDEARSLLHAGRNATIAAGMASMLAHVELRLAAVARQTGQLRLASVHAREAVALSMQQEESALRAEACRESSLVYEAQGHWRHALASFRDYAREREAWHATQATSQWRALAHRVGQERDRPVSSSEPAGTAGAQAFARDGFEQRLEGWRRSPSPGPLVVMTGGVDDVAGLRSRFSCEQALAATRRFGGLLERHLRAGDQFCAWDGEHHAIAFRLGTSLESALEIAHRLCTLAGQLDGEDVAPGFVMSVSFGLAVFGASEDLETALLRAAWALHDVRREGRGRARAIW